MRNIDRWIAVPLGRRIGSSVARWIGGGTAVVAAAVLAIFAYACGNASQACRHLGLAHAPGGAFATDPALALRSLARACDANDLPACRAIRTQLAAGLGDAASRAAAEVSHAGACRRKLRLDCRQSVAAGSL